MLTPRVVCRSVLLRPVGCPHQRARHRCQCSSAEGNRFIHPISDLRTRASKAQHVFLLLFRKHGQSKRESERRTAPSSLHSMPSYFQWSECPRAEGKEDYRLSRREQIASVQKLAKSPSPPSSVEQDSPHAP